MFFNVKSFQIEIHKIIVLHSKCLVQKKILYMQIPENES